MKYQGISKKDYFRHALQKKGTEFWCNNPTDDELGLALKNGAVGITTNPGYFNLLIEKEKYLLEGVIKEVIENQKGKKLDYYCLEVLKRLILRLQEKIYPLYRQSQGRYGYVAIQGNPLKNDSIEEMLKEVESFKGLRENVIIKVPATFEGAEVLRSITSEGYSSICTMSFTLFQYKFMAEAFQKSFDKVKARKGLRPKCYITMLPGILNESLISYKKDNGIDDVTDDQILAGSLHTAKKAYQVFKRDRYDAKILVGGARTIDDWTELLGNDIAITIGWSLAENLINNPPVLKAKIGKLLNKAMIEKLKDRLPDFRKAVDPQSFLSFEDLKKYGPFVKMQNRFVESQGLFAGKIRDVMMQYKD